MADEKGTRRLLILIIIIIVILLIVALVYALIYKSSSSSSPGAGGCSDLAPPSGVSVVAQELTKIKVSWSPVDGAVSYRVYIGSIPGFSKTTALDSFPTADTEYVIPNMVLGRTYYIKVESVNACGNEGQLSAQNTVALGFPDKFRIVSRDQPSLALKVAPDFENVIIDTWCSGNPGDDLCIWTYDETNSLLSTTNTPTSCMKTFPQIIDLRIKHGDCNDSYWYNWFAARQWNYSPDTGTLCNPLNGEGLNCVKINGAAVPGSSTVGVPYDSTSSMQWDIVQF